MIASELVDRQRDVLVEMAKSKVILKFTSEFRPFWLLKLVKRISCTQHLGLLADLFDPNLIRKKIDFNFAPRYVKVKILIGENRNSDFEVDINDHIGWKIFLNGYFDSTHQQVSRILGLSSGDIFLDIGANIGSVSIPIAMETNCEVIAIEANPTNSSLFLRNLTLNPIKVLLHACAVVDPETFSKQPYIEIFPSSGNQGASSLHAKWNSSIRTSVGIPTPTETLDNLISSSQEQRIKLIKLDIEGSEIDALKGFSRLALLNAPLIFEYRTDIKIGSEDSGIEKIPGVLSRHFALFRIVTSSNSLHLTEFDPNIPAENVIAIPHQMLSQVKPKFNFA